MSVDGEEEESRDCDSDSDPDGGERLFVLWTESTEEGGEGECTFSSESPDETTRCEKLSDVLKDEGDENEHEDE